MGNQLNIDDYIAELQKEGQVQKCPPEIGARIEHAITQLRAAKGSVRVKNYKQFQGELLEVKRIVAELLAAC